MKMRRRGIEKKKNERGEEKTKKLDSDLIKWDQLILFRIERVI